MAGGRDPGGVIRGEPASGYDRMDVGMWLQGLSPSVQNAEAAEVSTEMFGISRHVEQGGGTGFKQQGEENPLVLPDQGDQGVRDAKDEVIVADRQEFLLARAQPLLPGIGLAF